VLREIPAIRERFPIGMRAFLTHLETANDPAGDALVLL
jgi:hypothetical protein